MRAQIKKASRWLRALPSSRPEFEPTLIAAVLSLGAVLATLRGADYPAQYFRAAIYKADGFTIWNNAWYSGHFTPSYSLIAPVLSAWFGPIAVAVGSSVAAAYFMGRLAAIAPSPLSRWGAVLFAISTVSNVLIGRTAFALGMAIGLWSLDAWFHSRRRFALALALLAGLSTPVASVFLGLAAGAIAFTRLLQSPTRRIEPWSAALWLCAVAPLAAFSVAFGSDGIFRFEPVAFALCVVATVGIVAVTDNRTTIIGVSASALAAVAFFVIDNPMGGNFQRLPMFFAGALALFMARPNRAKLALALGVFFTGWAVFPAATASVDAYRDPSRHEAYYAPHVNYIEWHGDDNSRIEIPFTLNHWESFYVAKKFSLARGCERQADREVNPLFYDLTTTPEQYHAWLLDRAVRWVALPDVALDRGGQIEADLLANEHDWLVPVWENEHWKVWEVVDSTPILAAPAELIHLGYDNITIRSTTASSTVLRIRYMPYWTVEGPATISPTEDGLTEIQFFHPGEIRLSARFEWRDLFSNS
ncbi:MAG: hypothetical protein R2706_20435 [Acidimicrobiales bacterium]